jgi:hypothetical protein
MSSKVGFESQNLKKTYHKSFEVTHPRKQVSGFGSEDVLTIGDVEAGNHGGRINSFTLVIPGPALARVPVVLGPDGVADFLPVDAGGVVPVMTTMILWMEAFGGIELDHVTAVGQGDGGRGHDDDKDGDALADVAHF